MCIMRKQHAYVYSVHVFSGIEYSGKLPNSKSDFKIYDNNICSGLY